MQQTWSPYLPPFPWLPFVQWAQCTWEAFTVWLVPVYCLMACCWVGFCCMGGAEFIYLTTEGLFSCFQLGAILNKAVRSTHEWVLMWLLVARCLAAHMVGICLADNRLFSNAVYSLCSLLQWGRCRCCIPSPAFGLFLFCFQFRYSSQYVSRKWFITSWI